jgi:hypothetical protein
MIKPRMVFQEKGGQRECVMTTCNLNQDECPYGYFCDSDNVCTLMSQGICKEWGWEEREREGEEEERIS